MLLGKLWTQGHQVVPNLYVVVTRQLKEWYAKVQLRQAATRPGSDRQQQLVD